MKAASQIIGLVAILAVGGCVDSGSGPDLSMTQSNIPRGCPKMARRFHLGANPDPEQLLLLLRGDFSRRTGGTQAIPVSLCRRLWEQVRDTQDEDKLKRARRAFGTP